MGLKFALTAAIATPILHAAVLFHSGQDGISSPISTLSQQPLGALHTTALLLFGGAHVALAHGLDGLDRGRWWPYGRYLLMACAAALCYTAFYFATLTAEELLGPSANDPLWLVATLVGCAMGALQPGLSRQGTWLGVFNWGCLLVWLGLIPTILWVNDSWIGAYERLVGSVYVCWILGLTLGALSKQARRRTLVGSE